MSRFLWLAAGFVVGVVMRGNAGAMPHPVMAAVLLAALLWWLAMWAAGKRATATAVASAVATAVAQAHAEAEAKAQAIAQAAVHLHLNAQASEHRGLSDTAHVEELHAVVEQALAGTRPAAEVEPLAVERRPW